MSKVILSKCSSYNENEVESVLRKSLEKLGGLKSLIKPGQKVLLKVNLLQSAQPHQAATTHPSLVKAVAKLVKQAGGVVLVGDSPGDPKASIEKVLETTGIKKAAEEAGAQIIEFSKEKFERIKSPGGSKRVPELNISKAVLDADVIINMPKLKTHGFTLFTGAVKNMFGSVPGFNKASFHFHAPRIDQFCKTLVDIYEITKPALTIMDAIEGMEGDGPSAGHPKLVGAIIISTDGVAADAVASALIGFKPKDIPTTEIAAKRGLGEAELSRIQIEGEDIETLKVKDFKRAPKNYFYIMHILPRWAMALLFPIVTRLIWVKPEVIQEKCTRCLTCVRSCPTHTIKYKNKKVMVDSKKCIMCFCCHELCEYKAFRLKFSRAAKLLGVGK